MNNGRIYIQLGRNGDFFSTLPILYNEWLTTGEKPKVMIGREFMSAAAAIDFIEPVIWNGAWSDLRHAMKWAKERYNNVISAMCFGGLDYVVQWKCPSFQLEHWRRCSYLDKWGDIPTPPIPRPTRYDIAKYIPDKKFVLFADHSMSSGFEPKNDMAKFIKDALPTHEVLRLSEIRLPRPTDLLGLYDLADALVTIDTMHLHLSAFTNTPVLAFNAVHPGRANGSAYHPRFAMLCRYDAVDERQAEFKQMLLDAIHQRVHRPKLVHVWYNGGNPTDTKTDAPRRMALAKRTWIEANQGDDWIEVEYPIDYAKRTALDLGDKRKIPYINDMLDCAAQNRHHHDILVITNADTCYAPTLTQRLLDTIKRKGAVFCHRWDFDRLDRPLTQDEVEQGKYYPGADLFAFEVGWWRNYKADLPPLLLGSEWWDCLLRHLITQAGGTGLTHAIYHERHESYWEANRNNPANAHNYKMFNQFMQKWGLKN